MAVIAIAAAAVSAYGAIQQGQAAKQQARFNADVADQNAKAARANSVMQQQQQQRETYKRLGAIRANQGASGGTMEGSALDVLGETAAQSELEKQNIAYRGELQARGHTNTATLDLMQGKQAEKSANIQAAGTLLQAAGRTSGTASGTAFGRA
ncbi:MAG: hypothetical protein ACREVR_12880 [Burkholderiales bacterium]